MPVQPSLPERLALGLNIAPPPVLDYLGALGLHAVCIAERLGVFRALAERPHGAADLAVALQANERGMLALLRALEALGYVQLRARCYALTPMAARWTPRFRDGMQFYEWMAFDGWADLEAHLQPNGHRGQQPGTDDGDAPAARLFGGMLSSARTAADELSERIRLAPHARRLLDLGGGHGLYAARFCRRNPALTATLVDFAPVLADAGVVLADEDVLDRVALRAADFWVDDLGGPYDVILLVNILNGLTVERRIELLRRAAGALAPDGVVVIADQMQRASLRGVAKAVVDLTNLRFFDPAHGDTYALTDLTAWLAEAGLRSSRTGALRSIPWMSFVSARQAGGRPARSS